MKRSDLPDVTSAIDDRKQTRAHKFLSDTKNSVIMNSIQMNSVEDIVKASEVLITSRTKRNFEYNLNDKAAKGKLLKGAKRDHLEVVANKTSCNLVFRTGVWHHVILPSQQYWSQINPGQSCRVGTLEVKVVSVKTGKDAVGKHVDTQIVFFFHQHHI